MVITGGRITNGRTVIRRKLRRTLNVINLPKYRSYCVSISNTACWYVSSTTVPRLITACFTVEPVTQQTLCCVVVMLCVSHQEGQDEVRVRQPAFLTTLAAAAHANETDAQAPMPGVIEKVSVRTGQQVEQGDALLVMIAMKMEVSVIMKQIDVGFTSHTNVNYTLYIV